jgi:hypothetical protein
MKLFASLDQPLLSVGIVKHVLAVFEQGHVGMHTGTIDAVDGPWA